MDAQPEGRGSRIGRTITLVITNVVKVAGVYLAIRNATGPHDPLTYGVAAFMIAGGQVSEEAVLGVAARFFGLQDPDPEAKRPKGGRR